MTHRAVLIEKEIEGHAHYHSSCQIMRYHHFISLLLIRVIISNGILMNDDAELSYMSLLSVFHNIYIWHTYDVYIDMYIYTHIMTEIPYRGLAKSENDPSITATQCNMINALTGTLHMYQASSRSWCSCYVDISLVVYLTIDRNNQWRLLPYSGSDSDSSLPLVVYSLILLSIYRITYCHL